MKATEISKNRGIQPVHLHALVYARHGRELMGCKSPVRNWESEGDRNAKWITPIDQIRGEGNCGAATIRGEEAGAKTCEATDRNVIEGRVAEASGPGITKPFPERQSGK